MNLRSFFELAPSFPDSFKGTKIKLIVEQLGIIHGFINQENANWDQHHGRHPHTARGVITSCCTNFSPNIFSRWKMRKKMTAITSGIPSPPFRIMEPRGAPIIEKQNRQRTRQISGAIQSV